MIDRPHPSSGPASVLAAALGVPERTVGGRGFVVAIVGAGGKTSLLFALARAFAGTRLLLTTTAKMRDPRTENGRIPCRVLVEDEASGPASVGPSSAPVFLAASRNGEGKLVGIPPERIDGLRSSFDLIVVEADGARGLSVKAPSDAEPVVPRCADAVAGVVGLDCLGKPLGPEIVHRPELFSALVGRPAGAPIRPEDLARLAASPMGLFKGTPPGASRVLVLNKADCVERGLLLETVAAVAELPGRPSAIVAASLRDGGPGFRAELVFSGKKEKP